MIYESFGERKGGLENAALARHFAYHNFCQVHELAGDASNGKRILPITYGICQNS